MKNTMKYLCLLFMVMLCFGLCGCRQRVTADNKADEMILQETGGQSRQNREEKSDTLPEQTDLEEQKEMSEESQNPEQRYADDASNTTVNNDSQSSEQKSAEGSNQGDNDKQGNKPGGDKKPGQDNGGESDKEEEKEPSEGVLVHLHASPGTCSVESVSVFTNKPYGTLPVPFRSGYSFEGWFTSQYGGELVDSNTIVKNNQEHSLYAHWIMREGNVMTFDANGGRLRRGDEKRSIYAGENFGTLPTPIREGYDFVGWYTGVSDGSQILAEDVCQSDADITVYAHWEYNPYAYWSFMLQNTTQQIYLCQQKSVYIEMPQMYTTDPGSEIVRCTGSANAAQYVQDASNVTDEWVIEKNPNVIVKCISEGGDMAGEQSLMETRFPGMTICMLPWESIFGNENERLYYQLYLAIFLYPDWYTAVDLNVVASELQIN